MLLLLGRSVLVGRCAAIGDGGFCFVLGIHAGFLLIFAVGVALGEELDETAWFSAFEQPDVTVYESGSGFGSVTKT